jgi:hypothetical protein
MAKFDSSVSKFSITDTGSTERDMTAYITEIDGLPGGRDMLDVTVLGASGHQYLPSLENVSITLHGVFDNTATSGPAVVFGGLRGYTTAASTFKYGPAGSAGGSLRRTGTAWVEDYHETSQVGRWVSYVCSLKVHGTVTLDTY